MALLLAVAPDLLDGDAHRLFIIRSVGSARDRFGQRGQQLIGDALPLIADGGDDEGIPELFDTDMIADGQTGLFPEFRGEGDLEATAHFADDWPVSGLVAPGEEDRQRPAVQHQLGHRNATYTLQYARPSFAEMEDAIEE